MNAARCNSGRVLGAMLLLLAKPLAAEELPAGSAGTPLPGPWALQFRIERDFAFAGFQNAGLSVQRKVSDRSALRLGIGIAATSGTSSLLTQNFGVLEISGRDAANRLQAYEVGLQWIRYRNSGARARPYWGLGPSIAYGKSRTSEVGWFEGGSSTWSLRTLSTWTSGVGGAAGVEWWPAREIGLVFEYGVSVVYQETEDKLRIENPPAQPSVEWRRLSKTWETELASVRLGVGVRW